MAGERRPYNLDIGCGWTQNPESAQYIPAVFFPTPSSGFPTISQSLLADLTRVLSEYINNEDLTFGTEFAAISKYTLTQAIHRELGAASLQLEFIEEKSCLALSVLDIQKIIRTIVKTILVRN